MPPPNPLLSRKRDTAYLIFFLTHLLAMLCVDLAPLYPPALRPRALDDLRSWYIATYKDQFFTDPPAWFGVYVWMEVVFHVPFSLWAVRAVAYDEPRVPIYLLVYAVQTAVTTLTCIAEALSWGMMGREKLSLVGGLYAPYLGVSVFMGVDMIRRLDARISRLASLEGTLGTDKDRKGEGAVAKKSN